MYVGIQSVSPTCIYETQSKTKADNESNKKKSIVQKMVQIIISSSSNL